jgi:class III lanthionine synthetase
MSSIQKFGYTLSHPEFYEPLDNYIVNEAAYYRGVRELLPRDWQILRNSIWFHCIPADAHLISQGWKIHISTVTHTVSDLLNAVLPVLIKDRAPFKFAADPSILFLLISKQWQRGGAGKFLTIYPRNAEHFACLLEKLHAVTKGHEGPYVLSDRRYKDSKCLFYRYGGISPRSSLTIKGDRTAFIMSPEGERIPDRRQASFHLPPWVKDPFVSEPTVPLPEKRTLKNGRYLVESALRFTNTGGLYVALDTETNEKVVLKESRPLTNVNELGVGSTALLKKEYRLLKMLEADRIGPRPIDFFHEWEHSFLVEELLDGITIRQHSVLHNVTRTTRPSPAYLTDFCDALKAVFTQLAGLVSRLGRNHVVFRDLSPTNVLVLKNGEIRLVDFEAASELGVDPLTNLFTPGYASADHFSADVAQYENDYFSIGALMLAYLMPIHAAMGLDSTIHERFIRSIGEDYGLPTSLTSLLLRLMSRDPAERPKPTEVISTLSNPSPIRKGRIDDSTDVSDEEIDNVIRRILEYTMTQANYNRSSHLFPCDPTVFTTNPLGLAYGACGVAYAFSKITGQVPFAISEWILSRPVTAEDYPPGLYIGIAGIAWTLLDLGFHDAAEKILARSDDHPLPPTFDLFYGWAGWGMTQLRFYLTLGDPRYLEKATVAGRELIKARTSSEDGKSCYWGGPDGLRFGFAHGASGISLFLLYLYLATRNEEFIHIGKQALEFDLLHAVDLGDGPLWPTRAGVDRSLVPYWRYGSAGIGAVLLRYNRVWHEDHYAPVLRAIKRSLIRKHAIFPHKGFGLAGLGDLLVDMANQGIDPDECMAGARTVAAGVLLFQLDRGADGIAFPGADLWKISCDYITGSAGIALFLHRLRTRRPPDFMLDQLLGDNADCSSTALPLESFVELSNKARSN